MKQLIEDYRRRLATVKKTLETTSDTGSMNDIAKMSRLRTKQGEYEAIIAELEREYKSKLSVYTEVWVVQDYPGCGIEEVFIDQEDAEKAAKARKDEYVAHYRQVNKSMSDEEWEKYVEQNYKYMFKVISLDDAIWNIKDNIRDEYASHGDPAY